MSVQHLALPLRLVPGGRLATVEQDSADDLAQCVQVLLTTERGSRIEVPEYGVHGWVFEDPRPGDVEAASARWEPRADVRVSARPGARYDELVEAVTAEVRSAQ